MKLVKFFLSFGLIGFFSPAFTEKAEGFLPILEDMQKAKEIAAVYELPIALVFVGSDWCPFSQKFLGNVFISEPFLAKMKKKVLFVKIDFPELSLQKNPRLLEQHHALKMAYQIEEFPTIVLLDKDLQEITRIGYNGQKPEEYGDVVVERFAHYQNLVEEFKSIQKPQFLHLKKLYLEALQMGSESLKKEIVKIGLEVDEEAYFHLEKYKKTTGKEKEALKEKILSLADCSNLAKLRLALVDYQENIQQGWKDIEAIKPLVAYADSLGFDKKEESFRVHMFIAQHLATDGDPKEALKHAQLSLQNAPESHKEEIKRTIKLLQAEIIASKDF